MSWLNPISAIINGVSGFFQKKQERKQLKEQAEAKLKQSIADGRQNTIITDAEGEAILSQGLTASWKDEYVTIIVTFPIVLIAVGVVYAVFTGDTRVLDSGTQAITALNEVGIDMPFLMNAVVLSAIGLKVWRKS